MGTYCKSREESGKPAWCHLRYRNVFDLKRSLLTLRLALTFNERHYGALPPPIGMSPSHRPCALDKKSLSPPIEIKAPSNPPCRP